MNWYKYCQNSKSINDVIWAIDEIILSTLTEQDVDQMFSYRGMSLNNSQNVLPKAAQTIAPPQYKSRTIKPKFKQVDDAERMLWDLFNDGYSKAQIRQQTGLSADRIKALIRSRFPTKQEETEFLKGRHTRNVVETLEQNRSSVDFQISYNNIAEVLGISPGIVQTILKREGYNLNDLILERKFYVEDVIVDFVTSLSPEARNVLEAFDRFKKQTGHNIGKKTFRHALMFRNVNINNRDKNEMFAAFKSFVWDHTNGDKGIEFLISNGQMPTIIDNFVRRYGKYWGFDEPMEQEDLKRLLMTKIQLREKIQEHSDMGQDKFYNRYFDEKTISKIVSLIEQGLSPYQIAQGLGLPPQKVEGVYNVYQLRNAPMIYDESHPSNFLGEQPQQAPMV